MDMYEYETSEQLFLDIWEKYGAPNEVDDTDVIFNILNDLVNESKHLIVLDHYSNINFDEVIKVEYDSENSLFKLYWLDNNKYREAALNHEISEMDAMLWNISGYCTYEYIAVDINKLKFVNVHGHLFVLIQANMNTEKELKNKVIGKKEIIEIENCTDELYSRYIFWEDKEALIKVDCIANNLPYYVCVVQPKERIPNTMFSKQLLLINTIKEINNRLEKVYKSLLVDELDRDELFAKGNTIRNIMEYALKHYCVIFKIKLEIEKKYGYIELGDLRKKIKSEREIEITQGLINTANELSHDSGKKYKREDIVDFYKEVRELLNELQQSMYKKERIIRTREI